MRAVKAKGARFYFGQVEATMDARKMLAVERIERMLPIRHIVDNQHAFAYF